jgi:hypothetical protein
MPALVREVFPLAWTSSARGEPEPGIRMENLEGGETVLVVEEETFTRSVAVSMLERYGYTVLTATSGQEVPHV